MSELVSVTEEQDYCLIQMDDGKANALSFDMLAQINEALDRAEHSGKVLLITGRPGKFCAGFDLSVMEQGGDGQTRLMMEGALLSRRLLGCSAPVVLAVSGHALAMGALLLLSADYRIGVYGDYKLGLNEVAIGLPLPWFGVELARARLGSEHVNPAVGLARIYDPSAAVTAGYLDEVVEPDALESHAAGMAQAIASLDPDAHRVSKQRVRSEFFQRYDEALRRDFD